MSAKLLSSLVQTKSIELVLAPIAAQVSQLILLNEAAQRDGIPLPDLVPSAQQIRQAVESLVLAGQKLVSETQDNNLKSGMPPACEAVKDAGNALLMATHQLKQQPFSNKVRYNLVDSARNILEGTMKVLLVYDEAEIHKIVTSARWVMDQLHSVEAVTSPRGLIVSFKGFAESLMLLASLCNKRQQELSNPRQRDRLLSAMMILKKSIGLLSTSMQAYLKNPANLQTKASRDYVVGQIMLACTEIIKIVEARGDLDQSVEEPGYMAATLEKAHKQLSPHSRLGASNELDCYLDAIVRSSMDVANSCEAGRKEKILQACQSVLQMRNELTELQKAFLGNPLSQRTRHELDLASERLSVELKKLDRQVSTAVIDAITTVFADAELPVHNMIQAATAPLLDMSVQSQEDAMMRLKGKADEFQKHAARLAEVARQSAAISADARRVQAINGTSNDIEKLAPQLMSAAVRVRQTPMDTGCTEHLSQLRRDWTARIHVLTSLVDDITDFNDFVLMTDFNIQKDISRSQEALHQQDISAVSQASLKMLGRARRVAMVTKKEMNVTADPMYKGKLQAACGELESVLPVLVESVEGTLVNMADVEQQNKLCENSRQLGDKVKMIKSALKRPAGVTIDLTDYEASVTGSKAMEPGDNMLDLFEILRGHRPATVSDTVSVGEPDLAELGSEPVKADATPLALSSQDGVEPEPKPVQTKLPKEKRSPSRDRSRDRSRDKSRGLNRSADSEDLLFNFSEDDEMDRINRKALLGVSEDHWNEASLSVGVVRPIKPPQTSRAPVSRLLNAVKVRDFDLAERELRKVESRASALRTLAEGCAEKSRNLEGVRLVRVSSGEIEKLTPLIIQAARDFRANPRDLVAVERLQTIGREWASKVHVLSGAVDTIVQPWSAAASKLALAATSGDAEQLKKQVDNINRHVLRLRQLAVAAKAAADAEDYALDAGNVGEAPARDPASLQRVERVRVTSGEVERITPQLVTAAQAASRDPTDIANVERLELHRRDWASKVFSLVFAVDDVTVGTSAPVEQLTSVALAADQHALQENSRMLTSYSRTLKEMEIASTAGCNDPKKVSLAEATVNSVEKLTADLQDTARVVAEMASRGNRTLEQNLAYMGVVERMSLLQREWATKVHLLTALVDDLTAEASAPVDRLAGAALAVSKAELGERIQQQSNFEMQADELKARVARVRTHASKAVENSRHTSKVRHVRVTGDFIDRLTPQVIAAARALADNPDQPTVEHFQMLRRQWASKAQMLMATLDGLPDADGASVQDVFQDLLGISHLDTSQSFESLNEEETVAIAGSSRGLPSLKPLPSDEEKVPTSPSPSKSVSAAAGRSPEISSYFDDMALNDKSKSLERSFSFSDTGSTSEVRRLRGPWGSASETDLMRKALVDELHQRFSSAESLHRGGTTGRYRHHQRAASISGLSRGDQDWKSTSIEEMRARKSSKSIELAAQLLQEETDKWEEENNSIVKVAKEMAQQMLQIAKFARGRNRFQNKMEMIDMAKAIASNAMVILKFARVIAEQSIDERSKSDLLYYAEYLPTISTQLSIISSVKAATPSDISADAMLVKNAQNLMQAVVKTLKAAEAACVKGLRPPEQDASSDHTEAADLAFQWKKKLRRQRAIEALTASRDELGLRRREKNTRTPSLVDIVHV